MLQELPTHEWKALPQRVSLTAPAQMGLNSPEELPTMRAWVAAVESVLLLAPVQQSLLVLVLREQEQN